MGWLRWGLNQLRVQQLHAWALSRPRWQGLNLALFKFTARGLGYGLFGREGTGERWVMREILTRHDIQVACDIGANRGDYAADLIRTTGAVVHAFEPVGATFAVLSGRQAELQSRLRPHRLALGDAETTRSIHVDPEFSLTASLVEEVATNTAARARRPLQSEEAAVSTLDLFCEREGLSRLDFVKIDSEGGEREILLGMQQTLARLRPKFVQFEFGQQHLLRGHLLRDLVALLAGYRVYRILRRGLWPVDLRSPRDNLFLLSNHLAVREDLVATLP